MSFDFEPSFIAEITHFIACAKGEAECRNPAEDGVEMMKILCAIYRSAKSGHEETLA
jgi:predicted dehydrogenase